MAMPPQFAKRAPGKGMPPAMKKKGAPPMMGKAAPAKKAMPPMMGKGKSAMGKPGTMKKFENGTKSVPAQGQTITNGSWNPAEAAAQLKPTPAPMPAPSSGPAPFGKRTVPPA